MPINIKNLLLLILFAATTYFIGSKMKTYMNSKDVVGFEFIRTEGAAKALVNSEDWQQNNKTVRFQQHTRLDFLYIISYVIFFIFLARTLLNSNPASVKTLTLLLIVAGLCDAAENTCLLQILDGNIGYFPVMMFCFATLKFGLLALFLLWLIVVLGKKVLKSR
jgi:hypothetical protein